jgi:hypothetical protein
MVQGKPQVIDDEAAGTHDETGRTRTCAVLPGAEDSPRPTRPRDGDPDRPSARGENRPPVGAAASPAGSCAESFPDPKKQYAQASTPRARLQTQEIFGRNSTS